MVFGRAGGIEQKETKGTEVVSRPGADRDEQKGTKGTMMKLFSKLGVEARKSRFLSVFVLLFIPLVQSLVIFVAFC